MKITKRIFPLLVACLMIFSMLPAVLAADVAPGGTVQISHTFSEAGAIDGRFECSNSAFTLSQKQISVYATDVGAGVSAVTNVTAPAGAKDGDSCVITLTYQLYNISGQQKIGSTSKLSWTVTVKNNKVETTKAPDTTKAPVATNPPSTTKAPDTTKAWVPSDPQTNAPSEDVNPNVPSQGYDEPAYQPSADEPTVSGVDYAELDRQIAIAEGLVSYEYRKDGWGKLDSALTDAKGTKGSSSQSDVDKAATALKDAIAALVKMNYEGLEKAVKDANELRDSEKLASLFDSLNEKLALAAELLESGDQEAVDKAGREITDLIDDIKKELDGMKEVKEVEKKVEVEVEPKDDFCNISIHKVWPILFWISLALNIALAALIVVYIVRRRNSTQKDDTPLVDYNISDDDK